MVTNHLHKLRLQSVLKWVSLDFTESNLRSSRTSLCAIGYHIVQNLRFYRRGKSALSENGLGFDGGTVDGEKAAKLSRYARQQAQAALLDYLHSTRSFLFTDAEHMSRNAPIFLGKLVKKFKNDTEIKRSMTRLLRYHPINEFELFFESIGLKPSEYSRLVPHDMMFLTEDVMLLENYQVLCNYGIHRSNIGRIYKEAAEAFKSDNGVLESKLQAFKEMGLNQSAIIKLVSSSPDLLIGNKRMEFFKVLEKFKSIGIEFCWFEEHLFEGNLFEGSSYNFSHMLELLCLLGNMGCSEEQLGKLVCHCPMLLLEASGNTAFSLIGFLLKFGSTKNEICSMFLQFSRVQLRKFVCNLRRCYQFLVEIEMEVQEIGRIVRSHTFMLGSCYLKKTNSLSANLSIGKKRLRGIVKENPQILQDWVIGSKLKRIPNTDEQLISKTMRTKFLLDLGFVENSNEMRKALKVFRGKGGELQERFDCFVNAGLKRKDVSEMVIVAPQVLNQSEDVIRMKIDFLVNGLGYPISSLVVFPAYLNYTIQRVKLRFSMYDWLKNQKIVEPNLSLSTIVACGDKIFTRAYVNKHPRGSEIWQKLKKQIYPD
ncbi:Transcription termination factor like [Actinidia chinensis var. chinensis]|uniref:Transcription termination factor like n=1 Tax=Actinidia chinensis var. chinensis TaxID=1590841 RepID=A0A2R6R547_ACTCC|nr:Transcription termination factor like [Actinidia chinensis var. chinensis]